MDYICKESKLYRYYFLKMFDFFYVFGFELVIFYVNKELVELFIF